MELICDLKVASAYKSPVQRARVVSEFWFSQNSYCLACEADRLDPTAPNTKATDFLCRRCGHRYELKTFRRRPLKSLVDGAYAALISRIDSGTAPTLCLISRGDSWRIESFTAIHGSFLTPWVVEKRRPLSQHAQRAGWIGCNIRLDRIPLDGEIRVVDNGVCLPQSEVRNKFKRFLPLGEMSAEQRGWTTLTLSLIRALGKSQFQLSEMYEREKQFAEVYPDNRHIRAKIRQQLQVLRDLGVLRFEGRGVYSLSA